MSKITITNPETGATAEMDRDAAIAQIAKLEALIAAMVPVADRPAVGWDRYTTDVEKASAQAQQDARRAKYQMIIAAIRRGLEG